MRRHPPSLARFGAVLFLLFAFAPFLPALAGPAQAAEVHATWDLLAGPVDPPPMWAHRAIHDPVRHRMIVLNGLRVGEMWTLSLPVVGRAEWHRVPIRGPLFPEARWRFAAVYDPKRDRILVHGGAANYDRELGDVWALALGDDPHWSPITTAGDAPRARDGHVAIDDPLRDRMVIFGGHVYADIYLDDTWALDLSGTPTWTPLALGGRVPGRRECATAVYDPWGDRMVVFGGWATVFPAGVIHDDTWALSLSGTQTWDSLVIATRPPARNRHVAVVDAVGARMIVSGGNGWAEDHALRDTWALRLDGPPEWTPLATTGSNPAVGGHAAVYSPERGSLIQYAGEWDATGTECNELDLGLLAWSPIVPAAPDPCPPRRDGSTLIADAGTGRLLVYGGYCYHDLWSYRLDGAPGWTRLPTTGVAPTCGASNFAYDTARNRLIAFDGDAYWGRTMARVWALPLDGPRVWTQLAPIGPQPLGRDGFSVIYDPLRDRVLLYGGIIYPTRASDSGDSQDDLWALSLGDTMRWTRLITQGTAGRRDSHAALYDAKRDRMVILGGERNVSCGLLGTCATPLDDAWTLSLSDDRLAWNPLGPPLPEHGSLVLDPLRDRLLLWPGSSGAWTLSLADPGAWVPVVASGEPPTPRSYPGIAYDPDRDQMLVFGGYVFGGVQGFGAADLHALRFSRVVAVDIRPGDDGDVVPGQSRGLLQAAILGDASFSTDSILPATVTLAGARAAEATRGRGHWEHRDVDGDGRMDLVLRFAAVELALAPGDSVAELVGETAHYGIRGRADLRVVPGKARRARHASAGDAAKLAVFARSPAAGALEVTCVLPAEAAARLEAFDLAGRRVVSREVGGLGAGSHHIVLDDHRLPPGVYLLRLVQGVRAVVARAVLLE